MECQKSLGGLPTSIPIPSKIKIGAQIGAKFGSNISRKKSFRPKKQELTTWTYHDVTAAAKTHRTKYLSQFRQLGIFT